MQHKETFLPYSKTFVCFANSRKTSGRCVAGKESVHGQPSGWIRPVSSRPSHEISIDERRYLDGRDPDLLHVVSVQYLSAEPLLHQPENHLIDDSHPWSHKDSLAFQDIGPWLDNPPTLWAAGHNSYDFENNRIPDTSTPEASL